ncbi:cobalamin biosynthesis protein CobW [Paenibacillus selenitireducens]|uniref:Cobalamin biosynthesis protein CobW n=1 Tax=Paenibacillus selenitireducens TaxID=1324314 RepID=A0A1T2XMZ8_9BACL|nr:GTP-binding protein [Paenibacillus selenitireducens]OPA81231.1 cobalamin biosynthesis protein CobW [Paenibacillus selenitireducens]
MANKKIPVTVLSGYLGSGKTTVLNHVLNNRDGLRVAVIVNDMSEVNIDADLVRSGTNLSRTEESLVEMSNGCICCTLREDLLREVARLAKDQAFDYILIESSGISEPVPVAQTFSYADPDSGIDLTTLAELDCMVTVVDAHRFWNDFGSGETLLDRNQAVGEEDHRDVVDLLIDQIETCDVLLLNKCDLVDEVHLNELEGVLRKLQPHARLIRTVQGKIDPKMILNTGLFDFEQASVSAGWIQELQKESHTPETDEYGISSFVYRRRRPFHPQRLADFMTEWPEEVVRAKGIAWIAAKGDFAATLSQASASIQFGPAGYWLASMPKEEQEAVLRTEPDMRKKWDETWGDRINELVFIGISMNAADIEAQLDTCLVDDTELKQDWSQFENPLPWPIESIVKA